MEYQKIINLLDATLDEVPRFITKKWVEVHDRSGSADDRYKPNKLIRFKTSILRQIYVIILMRTLLSKEILLLQKQREEELLTKGTGS